MQNMFEDFPIGQRVVLGASTGTIVAHFEVTAAAPNNEHIETQCLGIHWDHWPVGAQPAIWRAGGVYSSLYPLQKAVDNAEA